MDDSTAFSQVESPRRLTSDQRGARASYHSIPALDPVPENSMSRARSSSSSALRASGKGKDRDLREATLPRDNSSESLQVKRKTAGWVVDLLEAQKGAEGWAERDRVILVLGSEFTPAASEGDDRCAVRAEFITPGPSADMLAPILYSPVFSNTLLLVGSNDPSPSIEALLSPSHLLNAGPDGTIYSILHPFTLPPGPDGAHCLPPLLVHATSLAQQFRSRQNASPRAWTGRRGSSNPNSSSTSPLTPTSRGRKLSNLGSNEGSPRHSFDSNSNGTSPSYRGLDSSRKPAMTKSSSGPSIHSLRDCARPSPRSRLSSFSRDSVFGGIGKSSETDLKASLDGGSPFDAVINFLTRASDFPPERALQDMLHQAVVLTTGVLPIIARNAAKSSNQQALPISLLHVLPSHVPGPLPAVTESFLLSFLPSFAYRGDREVWASVISTPAWLTNDVDDLTRQPDSVEQLSGAEVLVFGGLRCPTKVLKDSGETEDVKSRAFLASWESCMYMPGLVAEARRPPPERTQSSPQRNHHHNSPPSIAYSYVGPRTPPKTTKLLPAVPPETMEKRRSTLVLRDTTDSLSTPELDHSHSSCSSSSMNGDSTGSEQSEAKQVPKIVVVEKDKKGFSEWLKMKSKGMRA